MVLPFYLIIISLFFLRIQRIHHNIRVRVGDNGFVGVVNNHAGFAVGDLLNLLHGSHIHRDVLTTGGLGVVGCQLSRLGDGVVWGRGAAAGDDNMGTVDLGGMAPDVIFSGQFEGQLIILPVVPAHIDGIAVGGFKPYRLQFCLLGFLSTGFRTDIATVLELPLDFFQFRIGLGPVQLFQNTLQIEQLVLTQFNLFGQLFFCILPEVFKTSVVFLCHNFFFLFGKFFCHVAGENKF